MPSAHSNPTTRGGELQLATQPNFILYYGGLFLSEVLVLICSVFVLLNGVPSWAASMNTSIATAALILVFACAFMLLGVYQFYKVTMRGALLIVIGMFLCIYGLLDLPPMIASAGKTITAILVGIAAWCSVSDYALSATESQ